MHFPSWFWSSILYAAVVNSLCLPDTRTEIDVKMEDIILHSEETTICNAPELDKEALNLKFTINKKLLTRPISVVKLRISKKLFSLQERVAPNFTIFTDTLTPENSLLLNDNSIIKIESEYYQMEVTKIVNLWKNDINITHRILTIVCNTCNKTEAVTTINGPLLKNETMIPFLSMTTQIETESRFKRSTKSCQLEDWKVDITPMLDENITSDGTKYNVGKCVGTCQHSFDLLNATSKYHELLKLLKSDSKERNMPSLCCKPELSNLEVYVKKNGEAIKMDIPEGRVARCYCY